MPGRSTGGGFGESNDGSCRTRGSALPAGCRLALGAARGRRCRVRSAVRDPADLRSGDLARRDARRMDHRCDQDLADRGGRRGGAADRDDRRPAQSARRRLVARQRASRVPGRCGQRRAAADVRDADWRQAAAPHEPHRHARVAGLVAGREVDRVSLHRERAESGRAARRVGIAVWRHRRKGLRAASRRRRRRVGPRATADAAGLVRLRLRLGAGRRQAGRHRGARLRRRQLVCRRAVRRRCGERCNALHPEAGVPDRVARVGARRPVDRVGRRPDERRGNRRGRHLRRRRGGRRSAESHAGPPGIGDLAAMGRAGSAALQRTR